MFYAPGEVHPDYTFDPWIKETKYMAIFRALEGTQVKYALTFSGLSNFKFERQLIEKYPGVHIHCFEKDRAIFKTIVNEFEVPKAVTVMEMSAEDYLRQTSCVYDLLFLDYCSGPKEKDLNSIVHRTLSPAGVLAITLYCGRNANYSDVRFKGLGTVVDSFHYTHMYFSVYTKKPVSKMLALQTITKAGKLSKPAIFKVVYRHKIKHSKIRRHYARRLDFKAQIEEKPIKITVTDPSYENQFISRIFKGTEVPEGFEKRLLSLIAYLPRKEQEILALQFKGVQQINIAYDLGMTQGAVSSRLKRAAERIKFLKLKISSCQDPYEFDAAKVKEEIAALRKDHELSAEEIEWLDSLAEEADQGEYSFIAEAMDKPNSFDWEMIPHGKVLNSWLPVVFDAFDEICRRIKESSNEHKS
jgi:hypothetical protein